MLLCLAGCSQPSESAPGKITIAAASDLQFVLDSVVRDFGSPAVDIGVQVNFGSSGSFHAQLMERAPFDMFLSADIAYPQQLAKALRMDRESVFPYARGQLALWIPATSPLGGLTDIGEVLEDARVRRIAIANPRHAPYGRAAVSALRFLGLHDNVEDRLVLAENVAQVFQFVESGSADVGILAYSLALAPKLRDRGTAVLFPLVAYPPVMQGGIILPWARDREAAEQFRDYLLGPEGQARLKSCGFLPPGV